MQEGFIDLRRNASTETGADSFWPSFTDIMMVVVMIFMIASVVLMLRNWDLVQALRDTIESERQAEALALTMTETSATLEEQLAQAQHENSELRMRLMRASEINRNTSEQLSLQQQQLLSLQAEKQQLTANLQQAQLDRVGCFTYSPVAGARANELDGAVPEEVKEERWHRFMQTQAEISSERLRRKIGSAQQVLVDEITDEGAVARSKADAPEIDGIVLIRDGRQLLPGCLVELQGTKVTAAPGYAV